MTALHQALVNLVTNAVQALSSRNGVITIRTRYLPEPHEARIEIIDNGPGVPPERHDEIFDAFSSTKGQRGTGLGLAVTRKIVEEHGGTVDVESEVGKGSLFRILLPLEEPSPPPALDGGGERP